MTASPSSFGAEIVGSHDVHRDAILNKSSENWGEKLLWVPGKRWRGIIQASSVAIKRTKGRRTFQCDFSMCGIV